MSDKKKSISDKMDEKMVIDTESKTDKDEFKKLDEIKILTSNEILDNVQIFGSTVTDKEIFEEKYERLDIRDEIEEIDAMQFLTSNKVLDNIQVFDSTVEIIGFVDEIEASRKVGDKQQYTVFKFYINNGTGRRIQIVAWNDNIEYIKPHLKLNYIIHLDGVHARLPKIARFNNGNVPYELQVQSNTIVSNLGKYSPVLDVEPERIAFCDVINTSTRVELEGYIKSNFGLIYNSVNKKIGCGSITDGQFKLEVHILDFDQDEYELMKGDKVKIIGKMKNTVNPPCFIVESLKDVTKIKGRLPLTSILSVSQMLTKKE